MCFFGMADYSSSRDDVHGEENAFARDTPDLSRLDHGPKT
jgi:hypothetical protein